MWAISGVGECGRCGHDGETVTKGTVARLIGIQGLQCVVRGA
jgi:hypothetical protein